MGFRVEGDRGEHRPEDLLPGDAHAVISMGEQGGADVIPGSQVFAPLAAHGHGGPVFPSGIHVAHDLLEM